MRVIPVMIMVLLLAACGGAAPEPTVEILPPASTALAPVPAATQEAYPVPDQPVMPEDSYVAPPLPTVDQYPAQPAPEESMPTTPQTGASIPLTSGAMGPLLEAIALDLSTSLGIDTSEVQFLSAESVVWPDGGLGCPDPDMMYTQVLVEGILIQVQAGDLVTEYHTDGLNRYVRCDNGKRVSEGVVPRRG